MKRIKLFFTKVIKSVKGFENYEELIKEKICKTILHTFLIIIIGSIIVTVCSVPKFIKIIEEILIKQENQQLINYSKEIINITVVVLTTVFMIIINYVETLINILLITLLGIITAKIIKIKMKWELIYKIANYSIVLPFALQCIYYIIYFNTGYVIKYFQIMYILISYIYMISALIIIKIDIIRQQEEIEKIEAEHRNMQDGIDFEQEK